MKSGQVHADGLRFQSIHPGVCNIQRALIVAVGYQEPTSKWWVEAVRSISLQNGIRTTHSPPLAIPSHRTWHVQCFRVKRINQQHPPDGCYISYYVHFTPLWDTAGSREQDSLSTIYLLIIDGLHLLSSPMSTLTYNPFTKTTNSLFAINGLCDWAG